MTDIGFLETHNDLFIGGKNLGKKHRPRNGLELKWDEKKQCAFVTWNKETGRVFTPNINVLIEAPQAEAPKNEHKTTDVNKFKTAQVSSPMGHVFEGPGAGKQRDTK